MYRPRALASESLAKTAPCTESGVEMALPSTVSVCAVNELERSSAVHPSSCAARPSSAEV
eukprot:6171869-Pleurochrysis_carterae.AAC.4